jgi:hypothetical protein
LILSQGKWWNGKSIRATNSGSYASDRSWTKEKNPERGFSAESVIDLFSSDNERSEDQRKKTKGSSLELIKSEELDRRQDQQWKHEPYKQSLIASVKR